MPSDAVTLAHELDFRLGSCQVRPSLGLVTAGERSVRLEPRVMQVLVALARNVGGVVAREDILTACWGGVVVGDDALNRCIQRLRAAFRELGADGIQIETVPRVGYSLHAPALALAEAPPPAEAARPAEEPAADSPAPPAKAPLIRRPGMLLGLFGLAVAAVAVVALTIPLSEPQVWNVGRVTPLTSQPGQEVWPALSPDGGQAVYSARIAEPGNLDLYMQSVAGGQPIRLTTAPEAEYGAVWDPAGGRIAYQEVRPGQPCRILTQIVPGGQPVEVGRCRGARATELSWSADGQALVFSDQPAPLAPRQIYWLDLADGSVTPVTRALGGWGHTRPALSGDGAQLAYVDNPTWNVADLYILNLADGTTRRATFDGAQIGGVAWLSDGALAFTSTRAGDWGIWHVRPDDSEPRRLAPGLSELGRLSAARFADRLVVESWTYFTNLFELPGPDAAEQARQITAATAMDAEPDIAADGTLAFVSTRSGTPEVWTAEPGGEPRRLTALDGPYVHGVRWSPDGRRLAFAATRGGNFDVFVIGRDGGDLRRLTDDEAGDMAPAWSPDGRHIYFSSHRLGEWRIWRLEADRPGEPEPMTGPGAMSVRPMPDGSAIFVKKEEEDGIWRIDLADVGPDSQGDLVIPGVSYHDWQSWAVTERGIWYVERPSGGPPRLMLAGHDGEAPVLVAEAPRLHGQSGLAIGPSGRPVVARIVTDEIDLVKLDLTLGR